VRIPYERIEWDHQHDLARFAKRVVPAVVCDRDEWHELFRPLTPPRIDFSRELAVIVGAASRECAATVDAVHDRNGEIVVVARLVRANDAPSYAAVRIPRAHPRDARVSIMHADDQGVLPAAADPTIVVHYFGDAGNVIELPGWTRAGALVLEHVPSRGARVVEVRRGVHPAVDALVDQELAEPESFQVRDPSSTLINLLDKVASLPDEPPSRVIREPEEAPSTAREEAIPTPRFPKR